MQLKSLLMFDVNSHQIFKISISIGNRMGPSKIKV